MLDVCLVSTRYINVTYFDRILCVSGMHMEQAVPDPTSPRVYQSPGGAGAHFLGLNKLFFGYSILCYGMFCHCCRIGKDHQKRLKLGRLVIPCAWYKAHLRVLKLDSFFLFHGAPKMSLSLPIVFQSSIILWSMD